MAHVVTTWLLVVALAGAGLFNAMSLPTTREGFVRWGYPAWWSYVTGGVEILAALLIALPVTRCLGLGLGAAILGAALLTVLRLREYNHLAPIGVFLALIGAAALTG